MTLIGRSGSYAETSKQLADIKETELLTPNNVLASTDRDYAQLANVENTLATKTALNPERYTEQFAALMAYPEGSPAIVTYFHQTHNDPSIRSAPADLSLSDNSVHIDLTEVKNFEFRLLGPLDVAFSEEDATNAITGEGIVYPGFNPKIGDIFFMNMPDGKVGRFKVNACPRLTIRQGSHHKISFTMLDYLNAELLQRIKRCVTNTVYFDKKRFLDGDYSFLQTNSYVLQQDLIQKKRELVRFYFDRFFDKITNSLMRPDNIYDPYIVQYFLKKTSVKETKRRPMQLMPRLSDYHLSIWYALVEMEVPDLKYITDNYSIVTHKYGVFDTDITPLINRCFVILGPLQPVGSDSPAMFNPYVFSHEFYIGASNMTHFERLVYTYLFERQLAPAQVLAQVSNYRTLSLDLAFYHIPVYLHLIDEALANIK